MNAIPIPKPIAVDDETVTVSRKLWEAMIKQIELAEDQAAADRHTAWVASVGPTEARRLSYTADEVDQILDGTPVLLIWRRRAGLSQKALAEKAGISGSYLAEIESGKKPGSVAALKALAKALSVPMDMLTD